MNKLPTELLDYIFSLATYNPIRNLHNAINNPPPFEYLPTDLQLASAHTVAALQTKRALMLVCSRWRELNLQYMFEEILIRNRESDMALVEALEASDICEEEGSRTVGSYVKRILFRRSVSSSGRKHDSRQLAQRIVKCCPNVRIISHDRDLMDPVVQSCGRSYRDPYNFAGLSSLWSDQRSDIQRLDYTLGNVSIAEALAISPKICYNFHSLRVLSISIDVAMWKQEPGKTSVHEISLPTVHTLRLFRSHIYGKDWDQYKFKAIDLPVLRRLIVADIPLYQYLDLLRLNAQKIHAFEIGTSPPEGDHELDGVELDGSLLHCPYLEELHFPVLVSGYIAHVGHFPGSTAEINMPPIRHVGLHAIPWRRLERSTGKLGTVRYFGFRSRNTPQNYQEWSWRKLRAQIVALISLFKHLERITLYGVDWIDYLSDDQFMEIVKVVRDGGIVLRGDMEQVDKILFPLCDRTSNDEDAVEPA